MATPVPQRQLRNETAALLRRVEAGESIEITVHGRPVAELRPLERRARFVPRERLAELRGLLDPNDDFSKEVRSDDRGRDPFSAGDD